MNKVPKTHLEIQRANTNSPVGVIRSSYRENGKIKHKQFGRITGQSLEKLKILQMAFRGDMIPSSDDNAFKIVESKEHGASYSAISVLKNIGLDNVISSKPNDWLRDSIAMIAGRIVFAGSKLSLCNQSSNTTLWEQCMVDGRPDVRKHCYSSLDKLLERQQIIQKKLAKKHLKDGQLILYDITSSYLEGEYNQSKIVAYGYNRDGKKKHEQIVIGLICNSEGCPVAVEVFKGNTKDQTTVPKKINQIKNLYNINNIIFVGDRGMVNANYADELKSNGVETISALTRSDMLKLINDKIIEPSMFDCEQINEVLAESNAGKRYCLCKNPSSAKRDSDTRDRLIELTIEGLKYVADYKQKSTVEVIGSRVGKVLQKYKVGKFFTWHVEVDEQKSKSNKHKLVWEINHSEVEKAKLLDGCYVVTTYATKQIMDKNEVVANYKKLENVEIAFRNLKTVQLEMRPIYHKMDHRIEAHVFLCMLSYYVQWHMMQRLKKLFEQNNKGHARRWTFEQVIETLKLITKNKVTAHGSTFYRITTPTKEQQKILEILGVKM